MYLLLAESGYFMPPITAIGARLQQVEIQIKLAPPKNCQLRESAIVSRIKIF